MGDQARQPSRVLHAVRPCAGILLTLQGADELFEKIITAHESPGDRLEVYSRMQYFSIPGDVAPIAEAALADRAGRAPLDAAAVVSEDEDRELDSKMQALEAELKQASRCVDAAISTALTAASSKSRRCCVCHRPASVVTVEPPPRLQSLVIQLLLRLKSRRHLSPCRCTTLHCTAHCTTTLPQLQELKRGRTLQRIEKALSRRIPEVEDAVARLDEVLAAYREASGASLMCMHACVIGAVFSSAVDGSSAGACIMFSVDSPAKP